MPRRRMEIRLTAIDRAVAWLSPEAGVRRFRARAAMALASGYTGARRDRTATSLWSTLSGSADHDTLQDLDVLRARARDLVRNDPLARSAVSTKVVHVVGPGHVLRPEIEAARVGLTEAAAEAWEEAALAIWTEWARGKDCDATREQTFAELEDLVYRSRVQSGDVFAVRRFRKRQGALLASCLQIVEADLVSNPNWALDSATMAGGVELDADGAAIAYHFANRHALDRNREGSVTWKRVRAHDDTGRRQVLHIHGPRERPDLHRYAPMLAPVIEALKQRSRYSEAELMAAVVSACFAIGMESDGGDLADGLGLQDSGSKNASEIRITEPGQIFDLVPGEKVHSFEPGRPNPQFTPFIDTIAREVGAGTDLPHELLVKQFQASYSASRAAMEMAWLFFRADRALHVIQFCQPAYEDVITEAVARGLLKAPGFFSDPLRRRAWLGAVWMGPARPTIDPVKDATADEKYLAMGATSLTRITAERFGLDHRTVRRRRAMDGSASASAAGAKAAPDTAPADTEDDGDNDEENA